MKAPGSGNSIWSLSFVYEKSATGEKIARGWRANVRKPDGSGWKKKWLSQKWGAGQKTDAERELASWYAEHYGPTYGRAPSVPSSACKLQARTLANMGERWLSDRYNDKGTSINYYKGLASSFKNWILDNEKFPHTSIQNLNLESDFTISIMQDWINSLGGSNSSKLAHITAIRTFFRDCIEKELLPGDMLSPFEKPAIRKIIKLYNSQMRDGKKFAHLNFEQAAKLLTGEHSKITDYRRLRYLTALTTGMRDEEIQALTWADVDWKLGTIEVTKQLVKVGISPALMFANGEIEGKSVGKADLAKIPNAIVSQPKYNSRREIPMHPLLLSCLKVWKARLWRAYVGRLPSEADPIFPRENRSLKEGEIAGMYAMSDSAKLLRKDMVRLGLPDTFEGAAIVFHDLRHTFAKFLDSAHVDELKIGAIMGHRAKTVTRGNYIGENLDMFQEIISKLSLPAHVLLNGEPVYPKAGTAVVTGLRLVKQL